MAVNQSQVDHIITAASEDDPNVKLQNLEPVPLPATEKAIA